MSAADRRPTFRIPVAPDDLVRHALAAYYRAVGDATPPLEDPHPVSWSTPDEFLENLFDFMQLRVRAEASASGHEVTADPARLATWSASPMYRDLHIRDVDPNLWQELERKRTLAVVAGRSPVEMGQGRPALVPGQDAQARTQCDGIGAPRGDAP